MNRCPSGRNNGQRTVSPRDWSGVTIAAGVPPVLGTLKIAVPKNGAKRIVPLLPHVPKCSISGTSHSGTAGPPERSIRFSLPPAKNARDRPSGDQKTDDAPSVPGTTRASSSEIGRSHTRGGFGGAAATNASCDPSEDSARNVVPTL